MDQEKRWNFSENVLDGNSIPALELWYDCDDPKRPVSLTITNDDPSNFYRTIDCDIHLDLDEVETLATFLTLALSAARREIAKPLCPFCKGDGEWYSMSAGGPLTCLTCGGTGHVDPQQDDSDDQ